MSGAPIRVVVAGSAGRMGREVVRAVGEAKDLELVGRVDPLGGDGIEGDLAKALAGSRADVCVDFTHPSCAVQNAQVCLDARVAPIVGTSGIDADGLARIREKAEASGVPAMVVPNFAIGAVLMMRFAEIAASWMPDAEIIELHHERKADAPSGTAMSTAARISAARRSARMSLPEPILKAQGARGGLVYEVPVHSVRLPGLVAHQVVMFGSPGETLTIRHDSMDRASFMQGVLLAIRSVRTLKGLTVGLDELLFG